MFRALASAPTLIVWTPAPGMLKLIVSLTPKTPEGCAVMLGSAVLHALTGVLVDVLVIELQRDRFEGLLRRDEIDGEVVRLELFRLDRRLDLVGVAVKRLGPSLVIDQVVRRLEAGGDGHAVRHGITFSCQLS